MSYILDALKKSAQERQQGTAPHLYSVHSSAPPGRNSSPLQLHRGLWLIFGGVLLFFACLVILLYLNRQSVPPPSTALVSDRATNLEQPAEQATQKVVGQDTKQATKQAADKNDGSVPQVIIKENNIVLRSVAIKNKTSPPPRVAATDDAPSSLPQLKDLSTDIRAEIPEMKFAGHTFSEDPAQRMIIVNGQILREGATIAASTHLSEITWEGVIIDFKGTRFLVKTN